MHSITTPITPGAIIGYRKYGAPIRLIAGGAPEDGNGSTGDTSGQGQTQPPAPPAAPRAPADPQPQPPAQQQGQPAGQDTGHQPPAAASADELPAWAQRELKKVRDEAAANRVKAKEIADKLAEREQADAARMDAFAKALGLKADELTPEQIAEQAKAERDSSKAEAARLADAVRQSKVELAVYRNAAALDADGNALLDSRSFVNAVAGLDPAADDFTEQVKAAITKTVTEQPQYKLTPGTTATPPPPPPPDVKKPSADFSSPPQTPRQLTMDDVDKMKPSEVVEAMNKGLLTGLGFGKARKHRR
jgi:hypothetical protein